MIGSVVGSFSDYDVTSVGLRPAYSLFSELNVFILVTHVKRQWRRAE